MASVSMDCVLDGALLQLVGGAIDPPPLVIAIHNYHFAIHNKFAIHNYFIVIYNHFAVHNCHIISDVTIAFISIVMNIIVNVAWP